MKNHPLQKRQILIREDGTPLFRRDFILYFADEASSERFVTDHGLAHRLAGHSTWHLLSDEPTLSGDELEFEHKTISAMFGGGSN